MLKHMCSTCKRKTMWLELVENKGGYQNQYHQCSECGRQVLRRKLPLPRGWKS